MTTTTHGRNRGKGHAGKMAELQQIPLGEYIFRRILSLGVRHVLGVPGDFNRKARPIFIEPRPIANSHQSICWTAFTMSPRLPGLGAVMS